MAVINTKDSEIELINEIINTNCKETIENSDINRLLVNIKSYDTNLYIHSINVAVLSLIIGLNLFPDKKDLINLFKSALLHDYGKLLVSKKIINKSGILTAKERLEMERHAKLGYKQLLNTVCLNSSILLGILDHHERMDGTGYGKGKHEADISPYAKIIMIADVYDAMISDRAYRPRMERGIVYEYLFYNAGKHFDRSLVKCFVNSTLGLELNYILDKVKEHMLGNGFDKSFKVSI